MKRLMSVKDLEFVLEMKTLRNYGEEDRKSYKKTKKDVSYKIVEISL